MLLCAVGQSSQLTWSFEKLHMAKIPLLILLFPFLLIVHHFPQLPEESGQRLLVVLPSLQQLAAETGNVLFDLFQLTWGGGGRH